MEEKFYIPEGVMHVEKEGEQGEIVVLIHGTASYHFCWRHVTKDLSKKFRVFVPDLIGYGMSEKPRGVNYSKEAHAERVIVWLKTIGQQIHLVGHSIGGEIAVHIANKEPELLKTLTLVSPDGYRKGVNSFFRFLAKIGVLEFMFRKGMSKPPKKKFSSRMMDMPIEMLTNELLTEWRKPYSDPNTPYVIAKTIADDDTGKAHVKGLTIPILLVYGSIDGLIPKKVFKRYEEELRTAKIEVYGGCRHVLMEECPETLSESIENFINHPEKGKGQKRVIKVKDIEENHDSRAWMIAGIKQGIYILIFLLLYLLYRLHSR